MSSNDPQKQLKGYRSEIDAFDEKMLEALGERMKIVRKIAELKKTNDIDVEDSERERDVKSNWQRFASRKNLSWELVGEILERVLNYSKNLEK